MYTGKINLGFVCMVTHVEIDILKKFVVIRTVVYSIVKKDTPKFAIILENLKDVNWCEHSACAAHCACDGGRSDH